MSVQRLSIAIPVTIDVGRAASLAVAELGPGGCVVQWMHALGIHIPLAFLGHVEEDRIASIADAVGSAISEVDAFEVSIDGLSVSPSVAGPVTLLGGVSHGNDQLKALQGSVTAALADLGFEAATEPYEPSLVISRILDEPSMIEVSRTIQDPLSFEIGKLPVFAVGVYSHEPASFGSHHDWLTAKPLKSMLAVLGSTNDSYNADDVTVLEFPAAIRKRPAMYVGSTGIAGVERLVCELIDSAVDVVLDGAASRVQVVLHDDFSVEVVDNGPGIDLTNEEIRARFLTWQNTAATPDEAQPIRVANDQFGLVVVNALSSRLVVTSAGADEIAREVEWTAGGAGGGQPKRLRSQSASGTSVRIWPDTTIFETVEVTPDSLDKRMKELSALLPELQLTLAHQDELCSWPSGVENLLGTTRDEADAVAKMQLDDDSDPLKPVRLTIWFTPASGSSDAEQFSAFCNYNCVEQHESGPFLSAIRKALWTVAANASAKEEPPSAEVLPVEGLRLVASITMAHPSWSLSTVCIEGEDRDNLALLDERATSIAVRLIGTEFEAHLRSSEALRSLFARLGQPPT